MKKIIFILLAVTALLFAPGYAFDAKNLNGISNDDCIKIDEFIRSKEMIERIEFLLQDKVNEEDIDTSNAIKVNLLPYKFIDMFGYSRDIREMYGSNWQYKIPMEINGKKVVVTLNSNSDNTFEYAGISYGEDNKVFFINKGDIERELHKVGISDEDIQYSDILYHYDTNTIFVHFNTCKEYDSETISSRGLEANYLIYYSTTDFKSEFIGDPRDIRENGIIGSAAEEIYYLGHTSYFYTSVGDGSMNGGSTIQKTTNIQSNDKSPDDKLYENTGNEVVLEENRTDEKEIISGLLIVTTALIIIIVCKVKK